MKHENIVKLIGYALEQQTLYIVMELTAQSMLTCITEKQVLSVVINNKIPQIFLKKNLLILVSLLKNVKKNLEDISNFLWGH